ncbi:hypothetical protein IMCC21906_01710 [Spongiibacter sp. IMCC21906]|uniref:hypothetical protein n=1 Tax=Spongiibacter sp. IMCC21906 TaxID=1620392 RepID=UPI00062DE719|nr:hypothetical protein [Spongiibacter sp. IMCC21906]AKH69386.1 hypothetical protein IMCC21906_01710 [Spongiibacter sp. IMCC21906]
MTRIEPSGHIFISAKQFYDAAELIWQKTNGAVGSYVYPVIVNYALACELALKACESTTSSALVPEGALLPTAEINSTIWGHKLSKLFDTLASDTQQQLAAEFYSTVGVSLQPLLAECDGYFIKARYAWEKDNKCVFHLSGVRQLSSGLIAVVPTLGANNA